MWDHCGSGRALAYHSVRQLIGSDPLLCRRRRIGRLGPLQLITSPAADLDLGFPAQRGRVAEREGFEPSVPLRTHMISNHAHSTTLPPLRMPDNRAVRLA